MTDRKMVRVYHFLSERWALENIEKRRIKISTLLGVNDPFELMAHDLGNRALRDLLQIAKKSFGKEFGLLCFSKSAESPVQWAHYANRHSGLCLGFDVDSRLLDDVIYENERVADYVLPIDDASLDHWRKKFLYTKYSHWSYEQEVRAFSRLEEEENGLYFKGFDNGLILSEVRIGFNSQVTSEDVELKLTGLTNVVEICKVRPAFSSFRMIKDQRSIKIYNPQEKSD